MKYDYDVKNKNTDSAKQAGGRQCGELRKCFKCGQQGHISTKCTAKTNVKKFQKKNAGCGSGASSAVAESVRDMHDRTAALDDVIADMAAENACKEEEVDALVDALLRAKKVESMLTCPTVSDPVATGPGKSPLEDLRENLDGDGMVVEEMCRRRQAIAKICYRFPSGHTKWYHRISLYFITFLAFAYVNTMVTSVFTFEDCNFEFSMWGDLTGGKYGWSETCVVRFLPQFSFNWFKIAGPWSILIHGEALERMSFFEAVFHQTNVDMYWRLCREFALLELTAWVFGIVCFVVWNVGYNYIFNRFHTYRFLRFVDHDHDDERADSISLGKLKHKEAIYAMFSYTRPWTGKPWDFRSMIGVPSDVFMVSCELLTQLTTASVMDLNAGDGLTWEKIKYTSKSVHSVNIDRALTYEKHHVVPNTQLLALACYRNLCYDRSEHVFPLPLLT